MNLPEMENTEELAEAKHKRLMSAKASTMMREVIIQSIFLCLLLIVTYSNQDSDVFRQHQDMMNILQGYKEVRLKLH